MESGGGWWEPGGLGRRARQPAEKGKGRTKRRRWVHGARVRVADAPLRGLRDLVPCRAVLSRYGQRNGTCAGELIRRLAGAVAVAPVGFHCTSTKSFSSSVQPLYNC